MPQLTQLYEYLALDSGGNVSDLVVARNSCMARMLPGEYEFVLELTGLQVRAADKGLSSKFKIVFL